MALLTPTQVAQEQAKAEGFQNGPLPTVNPVNIDTQAKLGNIVPSVAEPVPHYPPATDLTPNLGLSLQGLDPIEAENMVQIDTAIPSAGGITLTVTLTAAQIKSMNTNPVLLVPGKPGYILQLNWGYIKYLPGTQAFNPANGDNIVFITGNVVTGGSAQAFLNYPGGSIAQGFIDQITTIMAAWFDGWWASCDNVSASPSNGPFSVISGAGIYLSQFSGTSNWPTGANWTLGNGTFKVILNYTYVLA